MTEINSGTYLAEQHTLPTQSNEKECCNWMSDARCQCKKHCRSLQGEHELYEIQDSIQISDQC